MAKEKKAVSSAPTPKAVKEVKKKVIKIPTGNPNRHVIRIAAHTWVISQPGNSIFVGTFSKKEKAVEAATRITALTNGLVTIHE